MAAPKAKDGWFNAKKVKPPRALTIIAWVQGPLLASWDVSWSGPWGYPLKGVTHWSYVPEAPKIERGYRRD